MAATGVVEPMKSNTGRKKARLLIRIPRMKETSKSATKSPRARTAFFMRYTVRHEKAVLPLVSFHARPAYDATEVRIKVADAIARSSTHSTERLLYVLPDIATGVPPTCPRCSSPMARRTALAGDHAGKEFWGCSHFPECREIVTI